MGYVVDVIDTVDGIVSACSLDDIKRDDPDTTVIPVPPIIGGLPFMVDAILKRTKNHEINVLRIWGHGGAGIQNIAAGHSADGWRTDGSLDIRHFEQAAGLLSTLHSRFYSCKSRIELRGCRVAAGSRGRELMLAVSKAVGVRVLAAVDYQSRMYWHNSVFQADPDGGFKRVFYTSSDIVYSD